MSDAAIEIEGLRKVYRGGVEALSGVSLRVPRGCVFGLLGPNGAGKSTLVKSLLTIIRPTACEGTMLGERIGHRVTLGRVGYLPEHANFPRHLTGRQAVHFTAGLAKVPSRVAKERVGPLLELTGMAEAADRKIGTYSKGMKQRIGLAQALVNEPELVILDEPTDGVDPEGRIEIREMVRKLSKEGKTVFVNSHLLAEVEQMADEVAIMAKGKVIESGKVADLTRRAPWFELRTQGPVAPGLRDRLTGMGLVVAGDRVRVEGEDAGPVQPVIDLLREEGVVIKALSEDRETLEAIFLKAVQRQGKEGA